MMMKNKIKILEKRLWFLYHYEMSFILIKKYRYRYY